MRGNYRGYEIVSMPPPSSGGVHVVQILNILSDFPLRDWRQNVVERHAMGDTQAIKITPEGFFGYADHRDPNGAARGF